MFSAQMLVHKSMEDGYLVGSRGSVGSSFAATMAGITEVNPLEPHYICRTAKRIWGDMELYDCGIDMPELDCQNAQHRCTGTATQFHSLHSWDLTAIRRPDIDLNFAGEYQATAHKYVGEIFGGKERI